MQGITIGFNKFFSDNSFSILNRENCKVLNSYVSQNNVNTMFGVFDAKKFAAEALFSYQAYEDLMKSGRKLGLENTVMGRNLESLTNKFITPEECGEAIEKEINKSIKEKEVK